MTPQALAELVASYRSGLMAELTLLERLRELAARQHAARHADELAVLAGTADQREETLASLVQIEHHLRAMREALAAERARAAAVPGFTEVVALHRRAGTLVNEILSSDRETLEALREAERARRTVAQTMEKGSATLAAYRRVVAPPTRSAIVDTQG
ncbi:MAG: hypothetical protein EHM24_03575 [Acidobacteria bacterium]|nr:MAG: hypothetical protein EHM24_18585 [Acidobacteriota bacterium]RPJ75801.1 MAG: hypothetical protein EHM24_03575 [Acidobacteriota bacterium]